MSSLYRSREGSLTAVDTKTQLSVLGSQTAPGALLVPAGARRIRKIIAHPASDGAAAADGAFLVRLEGPGLPDGPETYTVGASAAQATTGHQDASPAVQLDVDLPVTVANEILIFGEIVGADTGTVNMTVTLVFETASARPAVATAPARRSSRRLI